MSVLDPEILALLACPTCAGHPGLEILDDDALYCPLCRRIYEIEEGIVNLLSEEATTLDEETTD